MVIGAYSLAVQGRELIVVINRDESSLSDFERRVLDVIRAHNGAWNTFEQILSETLLPPDSVKHIALSCQPRL
jgi:hypothetical protein